MNKHLKRIKKFLILIFISFLCKDNIAAIVGGSDGSAFITKSIFENMKTDFDTQLSRYNSSLESKIDGAIANYLAGIKLIKKIEIPLQVKNYDEMMWQHGLQLYGKWKDFTANKTYTYQNTDKWCYPNLAQKRHYIRETVLMAWDHWQDAYSSPDIGLKFTITGASDGVFYGAISWNQNDQWYPAVPVINMSKDDEGWYIDHSAPIRTIGIMAPYLVANTHDPRNVKSNHVWHLGETGRRAHSIHDILFRTPASKTWIDYELEVYVNNASDVPVNADWRWNSVLNADNSEWPVMWYMGDGSLLDYNGINNVTRMMTDDVDPASKNITNIINGGATVYQMSGDRTKQKDSWVNLMLGVATDSEVRLIRYKRKDGERMICDQTGADDAGIIKATMSYATYSLPVFRNDGMEFKYATYNGSNSEVQIKIPYWPKATLSSLSSHKFKYNDNKTSLKIGQGLPLILKSDKEGYLHIKFDYDVRKILDNTSQNKKIYIDIKKDDFCSSGIEYAKGYADLVDADLTDEQEKTFNRYVLDTTTGKANFTVPIKADESLWLRIAPYDATKGLYAHMENLQLIMNYN